MTGTTPVFGIPYPDGTTKAVNLGGELRDMGLGMEAALIAAGVPAATNPDRIVAASDLARNAHFGVPSIEADRLALQRRGAECVRSDKGWTERYFATFNAATNRGGARVAGWYPEPGSNLTCLLTKTAGQTMPQNSSMVDLTWDTELEDRLDMHGGTTSRITVPVEGLWRVNSQFTMTDTTGTEHGSYIAVNGVLLARTRFVPAPVAAGWKQFVLSASLPLLAGDYLTVQTQGSAAAAWGIPGGGGSGGVSSQFNVEYIGPRSI